MRFCTVLAAGFLVGSFALAVTIPPDAPFAAALALLDPALPGGIHALSIAHLPPWAWGRLFLPLLLRPAWLPPAALGIIFAGLALTLRSSAQASRSRHNPR